MTHSISKAPGSLFVVATPIGNLADITYRAIETLCKVDIIATEDSRHSSALLKHYQISKPLINLHDHNEEKQSEKLIEKLQAGRSIALISDAGTPLISDPGYRLVSNAQTAGINIIPIPGPCAAIAALSVAGLPSDHFVFEGFLPSKTRARQERLKWLADESRTLIFYEAPHRILKLIDDMVFAFGEMRPVVIGREITKLFETFYRGPLSDIKQKLLSNINHQKGEFVVLVHGIETEIEDNKQAIEMLCLLLEELPLSRAVAIVSKITGKGRKELYPLGLKHMASLH